MALSKSLLLFGFSSSLFAMTSACGTSWVNKGARYGVVEDDSLFGLRRIHDGAVMYPERFNQMELYEDDGLVKMTRGNRYCAGTTEGRILLHCKYETIVITKGTGLILFKLPGRTYGLLRAEDAKVIANDLEDATLYTGETFARVTKRGKLGVIRRDGKWMTPIVNDAIDVRLIDTQVHLFIKRGDRVGLATPKHGVFLPVIFDNVEPFPDVGFVKITRNGRDGLADYRGNIVLAPSFEELSKIHDQGAVYRQGKFYGFVSRKGAILTGPVYESVRAYHKNKSKLGYDAAKPFAVEQEGLWGLVDTRGRVVVAPQYTNLQDWDDALILKRNGKYGVLSYDGKVTVPFIYDRIEPPEGGRSLAYFGNKREYVFLTPEHEQAWKRANKPNAVGVANIVSDEVNNTINIIVGP